MSNEVVLQQLQHLIGTRYVPTVKTYISELTGRARVTGPNEPTTREFDSNRINIAADDEAIITGFSFA